MLVIRPILPRDNAEIAGIIRSVLTEFGADKPGTVFTDPTTDDLFSLFQEPRSVYYVAEENGKLLGGCGIYPTEGLPDGCTELVKLYLAADGRGRGTGKQLMETCAGAARSLGFTELYLETLPELHIAVGLYEKCGFAYLPGPYGNSGHYACNIHMLKKL